MLLTGDELYSFPPPLRPPSNPLMTLPSPLAVASAAAGYANTGLLAVIFLYLVAEGIYQTGLSVGTEYGNIYTRRILCCCCHHQHRAVSCSFCKTCFAAFVKPVFSPLAPPIHAQADWSHS